MSQTTAQLISNLVQPLGHADGTEGAPTLSFKNDEDTGLFRPEDNTLGLATGGSTRLTIDSSGRLLVGATTAPSTSTAAKVQVVDAGAAGLILGRDDDSVTADTSLGYMLFVGNVGGSYDNCARIRARADGTHASGDKPTYLEFSTTAASASSPTERMRISANGNLTVDTDTFFVDAVNNRVGIGTTSPSSKTEIVDTVEATANNHWSLVVRGDDSGTNGESAQILLSAINATTRGVAIASEVQSTSNNHHMLFKVSGPSAEPTERMRIDNSGRLLINTNTSLATDRLLQVADTSSAAGAEIIRYTDAASSAPVLALSKSRGTSVGEDATVSNNDTLGYILFKGNNGTSFLNAAWITCEVDGGTNTNGDTTDMPGRLVFATTADGASSATTRMTIKQDGKVGIGETSPDSTLHIKRPDSGATQLRIEAGGSTTSNGAEYASVVFQGSGYSGAKIASHRDHPTYNDRGDLRFYSGYGNNEFTERMRIRQDGIVLIGTGNVDPANLTTGNGVQLATGGAGVQFARQSASPLLLNRAGTDGTVVDIRHQGTTEGNIVSSGTTISYNGAHLSRWSQLPDGAERTEILRGSVLSNIDEMCEWGEEDNEQLNRMKVSDVEGDKNVSGVFQAWDDDDDTYTNDFYCAMTGDFVIRIAQGVTVERGDLLMSAGDGTAKPQDDDIIRSKTVAKVTSTHVSCTYDDGSYCVPCVLMAC